MILDDAKAEGVGVRSEAKMKDGRELRWGQLYLIQYSVFKGGGLALRAASGSADMGISKLTSFRNRAGYFIRITLPTGDKVPRQLMPTCYVVTVALGGVRSLLYKIGSRCRRCQILTLIYQEPCSILALRQRKYQRVVQAACARYSRSIT